MEVDELEVRYLNERKSLRLDANETNIVRPKRPSHEGERKGRLKLLREGAGVGLGGLRSS